MRKLITTKINPPTINKLRIEGVGTFNIDALQGTKKTQLLEMYPELTTEQHETVWKAVNKGEWPEE